MGRSASPLFPADIQLELLTGPTPLDLPLKFRTIDYVREWLPDGGSDEKVRFTEEQMVKILREADATRLPRWRSGTVSASRRSTRGASGSARCGGGRRRLRQLEAENTRLKKLVAERDLEIEVMKEIAAKKW